jgi:hypothetical protein
MFITKKHLNRRALLRASGVSIALPLLDAMLPALSPLAQAIANPQPRLGFVFFPHGAVMEYWKPEQLGKDFSLPNILQPAAAYQSKMTIVSGLRNKPAESSDPHGIIAGTWLRCVNPLDMTEMDVDPTKGVTCDQLAAQHIGVGTSFPSIEVGTPVGGPCAAGFPCSYGSSLAFRTPTQPLPIENNPRKLFYQLFGAGDTAEERSTIMANTGSILDSIMEEADSMQKQIGASDRSSLSDYLESVREIERRVINMQAQDMTGIDIPSAPVGIPNDFEEHLNMLFDLIALSYQINLTNVATYMMEKEVSMRTYTNIGIAEAFHPLSHHGDDPDKKQRLARIQNFHTRVFTRFLDKLDSMQEGGRTVLDNSIILFGSNMSNSDKHNNDPLPSVVFGHGGLGNQGGNRIMGGQHLSYEQNTPHANLLLTLLNKANVPVEHFGDSTGILSEI